MWTSGGLITWRGAIAACVVSGAIAVSPSAAQAQGELAYLPLDGDASPGEVYSGEGGAPPQWVAGKFGQPFLVSAGAGNLPKLKITAQRLYGVAGRSGGRLRVEEQLPIDEWVFVAGVWDFGARTMHLYAGNDSALFEDMKMDVQAGQLNKQRLYTPPGGDSEDEQGYVFIGAGDFVRYAFSAKNIAIETV